LLLRPWAAVPRSVHLCCRQFLTLPREE
jgi:hypothetical protein